MKIVSDYKDYYDFYANDRNLSDPSYRWDRKQAKTVPSFSVPKTFCGEVIAREYRKIICGIVVCFCGRLIPCLSVVKNTLVNSADFYWNLPEDLDSISHKRDLFLRKDIHDLFGVVNMPWISRLDTGATVPRISLIEMHRKLGTPVFAVGVSIGSRGKIMADRFCKGAVFVNPCLKDIQFDKFMDGFQAFQELDRFISNELAPTDNRVVTIPDVLKAESHGFDKFSFRKDKRG